MQTDFLALSACPSAHLIEYVYARLPRRASTLARMFRETCGASPDVEDLVQVGIEYALRRLDKAMHAVDPAGYLLHAAQFEMLHHCQEQRHAIRVPSSSQRHGKHNVPRVLSLDAPLGLDTEQEYTLADFLAAPGLDLADLVTIRDQLRESLHMLECGL